MNIKLEIFFTKLLEDKIVYHKHIVNITGAQENPDDVILKLVGDETNETPNMIGNKFVIHSTSWRYENNEIVLTYIVYSDSVDFSNHPTKELLTKDFIIAKSNDSKRPSPSIIKEENVLSHAIRHLGFLIKTDEREKYVSAISSENIQMLEKAYPALAGKI